MKPTGIIAVKGDMIRLKIISIALLGSILLPNTILAQCATVLGSDGIATDNPSWYSCSGSTELQIQTTSTWADLVVDWGDGTATQTIGSFISDDLPLSHVYDGIDSNYIVTLSEADGSCSIVGHYNIGMPSGNLSSDTTQICQGNAVQFTQAASGVEYTWNFGSNDIFLPTSAGNVSFTFQNSGNYEVLSVISIPGMDGACTDTSSVMVEVLANPIVETTFSSTEGCGSVVVSAEASAEEAFIYVWTFGPMPMFDSGTSLDPVIFDTVGNHPVSLIVTGWNGCKTSVQEIITVHPQPAPEFSFDAVCQGEPTSFNDMSSIHWTTDITGWHWTFGDGNESFESNPSNNYAFTGDYNVTLVATSPECSASTSQLVSVHPNPSVEIVSSVESGCSPLDVNLTAEGLFASDFVWNFGATSAEGDEATHTLITALDEDPVHAISVTATSPQGCTAAETVFIEALPSAIADFSIAADAGCAPFTPVITNTSLGATDYEWLLDGTSVGDTSNWTTALENNGEFIVNAAIELIAIAENGCNDTTLEAVVVYPQADFSFALPTDSVCSPLEFTLPSVNGAAAHEWNLGNGISSNEENPNVFYQNTGTGLMGVSITYAGTSAFGCTDMHTETVYILPQPVASFNTDEIDGCEPLAANFENTTTNADSYLWDFDNGITDDGQTASYAFSTAGEVETYTVTLTATDDLGCSDVATQTVTVYPAADFALDLSVTSACSPVELTLPAFEGLQNFDWNFGDGSTSAENGPTHIWENESDDLVASIITLEAETEYGCGGMAVALLQVNPSPSAQFNTDINAGCEPLAVSFLSETTLANEFMWDFGNGETAFTEHADQEFMANSDSSDFAVTLTVTHELGCTNTATQTVAVFPSPVLSLAFEIDSACSPLTLTMPNVTGLEGIAWNFGDGTTSSEIAPSHTWENNTDLLMTATVTFSAQTENGCAGTASTEVHIKPQPVANFTASDTSGCEPLITTFDNNSSFGDMYIWNFGEALVPGEFNLDPSVDHEFNASGDEPAVFTVTLLAIDDLGCTDERTLDIEVFPAPEFSLELAETEACAQLILTMPEMDADSSSYWSFGDGTFSNESTPTHSWSNSSGNLASYPVLFQGSNAFGCSGNASANVYVKPQPIAAFSTASADGCAPFEASIVNMSERADSFSIDFGNGINESNDGFDNILYTFEGEATVMEYTVSLTANHELGCSDVHEEVITVFPSISAAWSGVIEGCSPLEATIALETTDAAETVWNLNGETFNGFEFNETFEGISGADSVHTIALEVTSIFGCEDSTDIMVTVHPVPELTLSTSSETSCSDEEWIIFNDAQYADSTVISLSTGNDFINPSESLVMNMTNTTNEDLIIELTQVAFTEYGCSAASGLVHIVHPEVTADFAFPEAACTPLEANFTNNSANATGTTQWSFGDGTISHEMNPTHLFSSGSIQDSTFTVALLVTSEAGCADSTSAEVLVFGRPVAEVTLDSLEGCYPIDVTFANNSIGHTMTSWNYGNGEFGSIDDSVHTKTFFNPTEELITYTTELSVTNDHNCTATSNVSFDVTPHLNAQFDMVVQGCSPVDGQLINQSEGAASYIWNFDDGSALSNEANPSHVFVNNTNEDQTFQVELIALSAYGCIDTVSVGVEVYPMPEASFSVTPAIQTYPNTTVGINNGSLASSSAIQYWSFGDGDEVVADQPIFHTFDSWGTYNITLLVDNGICADAHTEQINILSPHPVASFVGNGSGCAPLMVAFENNSNHGAGYVWDFDDDQMTSEESPVHVFTRPGLYNVSLTVIGYEGQEEQIIHYGAVEVFPSATAAFVNSPTEVIIPDQPVEFVNLSDDDSIEFLWNFGDGQVSTEADPIHLYTEPGIYDVTLTANNAFNCPTSYTLEHAVEATTGGFMEFPTAFTPIYGGGTGGGYDPAALDNNVFHPHHTGIVEYELIIFNKWGELVFRSTDAYIGWDGYFEGVLARQDVYAWKATAVFSNGHRVTKAGDVTLIVQ